jgi:3-deoxy-D-manno-octulosonic-acid transferase
MGLGLPADKVALTGNLKYDMPPDPSSESTIQSLRQIFPQTARRKYIVAGSTHPGEEVILLDAFSRLKKNIPTLSLILAPRNIERAEEICRLAVSTGWSAQLLTYLLADTSPDVPDVVVVNTIGHLKSLYALCDVAFVGGSLLDFGGHNPLEPAAFSKPVMFGPHTGDVAESCRRLLTAGGALMVNDADELTHAVHSLITDPEKFRSMGHQAHRVLMENQGALEKNLNIIQQFIPL